MGIISQLTQARNDLKKKASKTPEVEKEMSFLDHLEELRWHIMRSVLSIVFFAVFAFLNVTWLLDKVILAPFSSSFPLHRLLCHIDSSLCFDRIPVEFIAISPYEQFLKSISISLVVGLIFSFPYILWEMWRFIRPGLHQNEIRGLRGTVAVMSLLFFVGISFAYFIIAPFSVQFLAGYQLSPDIQNQWKIGNVVGMITQIALGGGLIFELPVLVYYLAKIGLITPEFMISYRRHGIVVLLILAAIITPPDWISQILIFIPLYGLYEISIRIAKVVARKREAELKGE